MDRGGGETEDRKGKTPDDMSNWERLVYLMRADFGGEHVVGGGPDPQGEKGIQCNWTCGGSVEGICGNFKLPDHSLHHLPRLSP